MHAHTIVCKLRGMLVYAHSLLDAAAMQPGAANRPVSAGITIHAKRAVPACPAQRLRTFAHLRGECFMVDCAQTPGLGLTCFVLPHTCSSLPCTPSQHASLLLLLPALVLLLCPAVAVAVAASGSCRCTAVPGASLQRCVAAAAQCWEPGPC